MTIAVSSHPSALQHDSGRRHPERPARIDAALDGIRRSGIATVAVEPTEVSMGDLSAVHTDGYIEAIERFCRDGGGHLDPDTHVGQASWEASLRAAGAGVALSNALRAGDADLGFSVMRPPGHHAEAAKAMGFCIFNNIAVTARRLALQGDRVAIVDWDVHHGNGTQDTFYDDAAVLYISTHQAPFYPGTGAVEDRGGLTALDTTINVPLPAGTNGGAYRTVFDEVVVPHLQGFGADWLLVSAGYDAHLADPLAGMSLGSDDFGALAYRIRQTVPDHRTIFFLEGGYDLDAIATSVDATMRGFSGSPFPNRDLVISDEVRELIGRVTRSHGG